MTARTQIALRVNEESLARVDKLAEAQERTRSDVLRRCLARGLAAEEADEKRASRRR